MNPRNPPARRHVEAASDAAGVSRIGGRPIHAYWLLLAPYVRDVLLAPERHLGDHTLAWSWSTPEGDTGDDFTPNACADARSRLAAALERLRADLADNTSDMDSDERQRLLSELVLSLDAWAGRLLNGTDAHVAGFLARTHHGLMFHSWGLAAPARSVAPSSSDGQGDHVAASAAGDPTAQRGRFRKWLLRLSIVVALVLGVFAGMRACSREATPSTTSVTAGTASIPAGGEENAPAGSAASPRRTETASSATPIAATRPPANIPTTTAWPVDPAGGSSSVAAGTSWSAAGSRTAPSRSSAGETFEGRDAAPALPSAGASGPARIGGAAAAGSSGAATAPAASAGAGQTLSGASSGAGGASAPVSGSVVHGSGSALPERATPAAQPSKSSSAGNRTIVAPTGDSVVAKTPADRSPREPQPPPPTPSGATADEPVTPIPNPSSSEARDTSAKPPPSPDTPHEATPSQRSTESEENESNNDGVLVDAPGQERPARTHETEEASSSSPDLVSDEAERIGATSMVVSEPDLPATSGTAFGAAENVQHVHVRTHTWRAELLRDVILPTSPQPAGRMDAINPMRAQLWQQHNATRPAWIAHPRIHLGITLSWSDLPAIGELHLSGIDGSGAAARWISSNELELSWPSGAASAVATLRSSRADDRQPLARIGFSADGVEVRAQRPLTVRTWLSMDVDRATHSAAYEWRLLAGSSVALPSVASDAEAARIGLYSNEGGGPTVRTIALVDLTSGWALVGEVEVREIEVAAEVKVTGRSR